MAPTANHTLSGSEVLTHELARTWQTPAERDAAQAEQQQEQEEEQRHFRTIIQERARQWREQAANAARGPPPEPFRDFRVPADMLPEVMAMWDLLQVRAWAA